MRKTDFACHCLTIGPPITGSWTSRISQRFPANSFDATYNISGYYSIPIGKRGWSWSWVSHPVTWLKQCIFCKRLGSRKQITSRSWRVPYQRGYERSQIDLGYGMCCVPCWNKVRALLKKQIQAKEVEKTLIQLRKVVYHVKKDRDIRTNP